MRFFSLLFSCILLAACAQTITRWPAATPQEMAEEARLQENYVRQERMKGLVHGVYDNSVRTPIGPRLKSVAARIAPAAVSLCAQMLLPDPTGCAYDIHVKHALRHGEDVLIAYADGQTVYITPSLVRFTQNNDELAAVIAHEFASDMMGHAASGKQNEFVARIVGSLIDDWARSEQGYNTHRLGDEDGAIMSRYLFSPQMESEADYVGLYLMARAGYDYHNVADFWRRMSLENPDAMYISDLHPTNPERYVALRKTVAEIDEKKRLRLPLLPQLKSGAGMTNLVPNQNRVAPPLIPDTIQRPKRLLPF